MQRHSRLMILASLLLVFSLGAHSGLGPISPARAADGAPSLSGVQPEQAANDIETTIQISGSGFSNAGGLPQVVLGARLLSQVTWVSESALEARVPWGLEPGTYSLRVENPGGGEAVLEAAFEVLPGIGLWNASAMDGGPVRDVVPAPSTPGLLYAVSVVTSAVYRSTDYGAHWSTMGHAGGEFLTVDPADPDTLYLNLLRSTDGGATWSDLLQGGPWPGTERRPGVNLRVYPDPAHAGVLFMAAAAIPAGGDDPTGLLRSLDSGQTWTPAQTGLLPGDTHVTALEFLGGEIFLGTRDGNLYRSGNGGESWQRVGDAPLLPSLGIVRANPYETDELWLATHYQVTAHARLAKLDLGEPLPAAVPVPAWPEASYPRTLGFLDADSLFIACNWDNGWISTDDGGTWDLFQPDSGKPGYSLALDPWDASQSTFYIADEQYGVQKTGDRGASWAPANQGLHAMSPDYLEVDPEDPARIYAKIAENGWPGIFISANGGQTWDFSPLEPGGGEKPVTSMLAVSEARLFAGAHGLGPQLYISEDRGGSWTRQALDPAAGHAGDFHMPWILKADPRQTGVMLLAVVIGNRDITSDEYVSEIYRSTDQGDTWEALGLETQVGHAVHNLRALAFDPLAPDTVYAAGDHEILKSLDNGRTWSVIRRDEGVVLGGPIAIEPAGARRVYVGEWVSPDGGETWALANLPLRADQMLFAPGGGSLYIAGEGLAYSDDGGSTWRSPEGPLATARINALALGRSGERTLLYVGTPGGPPAPTQPEASAAPTPLEAGVYRMTSVRRTLFLPMLGR